MVISKLVYTSKQYPGNKYSAYFCWPIQQFRVATSLSHEKCNVFKEHKKANTLKKIYENITFPLKTKRLYFFL